MIEKSVSAKGTFQGTKFPGTKLPWDEISRDETSGDEISRDETSGDEISRDETSGIPLILVSNPILEENGNNSGIMCTATLNINFEKCLIQKSEWLTILQVSLS